MVSIHTYALWALAGLAVVVTPNLTANESFAAPLLLAEEGDITGTITVPVHLTAGSEVQIGVTDPTRANQVVPVTIQSDDNPGETMTVDVQLDGDGKGTATFLVPCWDQAFFSTSGTEPISRLIY